MDPDQNRQSMCPDVDRNHLSSDNLKFANSLDQIRTDRALVLMWLKTICLLITFANSLDPDQNKQSMCPDVDLNYLSADNLKFANILDPDQN